MAYSEEFISDVLTKLSANDGNVAKTSRETGVSRPIISRWRDNFVPGGDVGSVRTKVTQKKESLADMLETIAMRTIQHVIKTDSFENASYTQQMTGTGIAIDKMRLLRGQGDDAKRGMDDFLGKTDFGDVE